MMKHNVLVTFDTDEEAHEFICFLESIGFGVDEQEIIAPVTRPVDQA